MFPTPQNLDLNIIHMYYQAMESNWKFQKTRPVYPKQAFMLIFHRHIRVPGA